MFWVLIFMSVTDDRPGLQRGEGAAKQGMMATGKEAWVRCRTGHIRKNGRCARKESVDKRELRAVADARKPVKPRVLDTTNCMHDRSVRCEREK